MTKPTIRRDKARASIVNAQALLEVGLSELDAGERADMVLKRVNSALVDLEDAEAELTPKQKQTEDEI